MRIMFYALFCLLGFSFATHAQNATQTTIDWDKPSVPVAGLPPEFQKQWTLMSCEKGEVLYRLSAHFALVTTGKGSQILRLQNIQHEASGYYILPPLGETYRYFIGQNGDLIQLFGNLHKSVSPEAIEKKTAFIPHIYYKDCQGNPPPYLKEDPILVTLMPLLDIIHQECPDTQSIHSLRCQTAVMQIFDRDHDLALNQEEAQAAWDMISPYSNIRNNCSRIETTPLEELLDFNRYYKWMQEHLDINHDNLIALTELTAQWENMRANPLMNTFINVLETAQKPLELLPATDVAPSTNVCAGKTP